MGSYQLTFCAALCRVYHCSPEQCKVKVFWRSLHRRALPWVRLIEWLSPRFFERDYLLIEEAIQAKSQEELQSVIRTFYYDCRTQENFLHNTLRLRISGRRLLQLYAQTKVAVSLQQGKATESWWSRVAGDEVNQTSG